MKICFLLARLPSMALIEFAAAKVWGALEICPMGISEAF
jgi:hypothetical protein